MPAREPQIHPLVSASTSFRLARSRLWWVFAPSDDEAKPAFVPAPVQKGNIKKAQASGTLLVMTKAVRGRVHARGAF
jgi:hypothetical protein